MIAQIKSQRILDPLHNLIEFDDSQFEQALWQVIQTPQFQRLRRIKQLGFSEFVYPGATHTRFSHSVGVFHTARQLMEVIRKHIERDKKNHQWMPHQAQVALAAALVHDLGHGMFSHSFEEVGKKLDLKMASHEHVSDVLIRESEISQAFSPLGKSFAEEVAELIGRRGPTNLYDAVVSSQFDADRLDYMRRDRLMTGVQNSGIDFDWLKANLEVGSISVGVDEEEAGYIDTFVLGPKAHHAAETFVLALFQLYPSIYYHKTTRGAEKLFAALMVRLFELVKDGHVDKTALPKNHPFSQFAMNPNDIQNVLNLDDTVFWGALPLLAEASDKGIREMANCFRLRQLYKCIDIHQRVGVKVTSAPPNDIDAKRAREISIEMIEVIIEERLTEWADKNIDARPRLLIDRDVRDPYTRNEETKGPLNQIWIRDQRDQIRDMAEVSLVVAALEEFKLFRVYVADCDEDARISAERIISDTISEAHNA